MSSHQVTEDLALFRVTVLTGQEEELCHTPLLLLAPHHFLLSLGRLLQARAYWKGTYGCTASGLCM